MMFVARCAEEAEDADDAAQQEAEDADDAAEQEAEEADDAGLPGESRG